MPFTLDVSFPGTGYASVHEDNHLPNNTYDGWKNDYNVRLTPKDFPSDYLDKQFEYIDIPYDGKAHKASEFLKINDKNAKITFEGNKEPSFTEVGEYTFYCNITSIGYYDDSNNGQEALLAEFNVKIVKAKRSDFSFLVPEPADITVPSNEYYSNPATSNIEPEPIEYYSSAPEIATVDKDTGNVDFLKAGTVTVKAVMPENDHYLKSEATYTISGKYKMSASFIEPTLSAQYGATIPKNGLNLTGIPNPPASATEARYKLVISKGTRKYNDAVTSGEALEYNKSYPIFKEKPDASIKCKIRSGNDYIDVNETTGEIYVKKAGGNFVLEVGVQETEKYLFGCIISDATACCSQGIEFIPTDDYHYPEGFPQGGENITVTGVFEILEDNGEKYIALTNAVIISP